MKIKETLSEKIIKQLQSKHDSFLGTEGEEERKRFKLGLAWAIDTVETLTEVDKCEQESLPEITEEEIEKKFYYITIPKNSKELAFNECQEAKREAVRWAIQQGEKKEEKPVYAPSPVVKNDSGDKPF